MEASVGPTAESFRYGDAVFRRTSTMLSPKQFKAQPTKVISATEDNGWLGPLGVTTMHPNSSGNYGYGHYYGVTTDNPQY